ncbi:allophanate hydrolase subunit 1 [Dolosicoccus paucivorans]|nr:allophanate hydrolase subunit 1 [Dolosicoccus paucivorans]SDI82966.1 hypothetical protein SAMN04487994_10542 [Dolosicoccus paucivorans]
MEVAQFSEDAVEIELKGRIDSNINVQLAVLKEYISNLNLPGII